MSNTNDKYCVYVHINKINGKVYVGQTRYGNHPNKRWLNGSGYKNSPHFYNAIQKYGWDNFDHIVCLSNLSLKDANYFEETLIKKLNSTNPTKGYNSRTGGANSRLSKQTRQKISQSCKGKNLSKETKDKISKALRGQNNPWFGKKLPEEVCQKISDARKGINNPRCKKVLQYDTNNNLIAIWDYMTQASKELNITQSNITKCCTGQRKTAGGFIWKYADIE